MSTRKPMTIGQVARRAGVSVKALREYERLGLVNTLGRSESNYRLFDESAFFCLWALRGARSLGLTLKDLQELATVYQDKPGEPIGPDIREKLNQALSHVEARMAELEAVRQRNLDFQATYAKALAGEAEFGFLAPEPRPRTANRPS